MHTVSIVEAKNQLSKLIHNVEAGGEVVLTRHGQPVAKLVSPTVNDHVQATRQWADQLRSYRSGRDLGVQAGTSLPELIAAGRR